MDVRNKYYQYLRPAIDNWGAHWLVKHSVTNWRKGVIRLMLQKKDIETINGRVRLRKNKGSREGAQVEGEGPNYHSFSSLSHEERSGDNAEIEEIPTRRGCHTTRNTLG